MLTINHWYNHVRVQLGLQYWSLSAYLKTQVKDAVKFISDFEDAMAAEARRHGYDGVICGHIHKAESRMIDGIHYVNDGDWVESCTALVEHMDGRLEIIEWAANRNFSMLAPHVTDESKSTTSPREARSMRLALVTDAWAPQTNGVVRTLMRTRDELTAMGHAVEVISPDLFNGFPCPTYPEIKLAFLPGRKIARTMAAFRPNAIHIATEGPLGHAARGYCLSEGTAFHHRLSHALSRNMSRRASPCRWA